MLSFLRCVLCCDDEINTGQSSSEFFYNESPSQSFNYHVIPQTATTTRTQENFCTIYKFPPKSNTPSVYNPPKPTLARINVNANSGVNPKKPPDVITATRTNVFPKSISSSSCPRLPPSPPSNTTSVYNPPKPTLAKINVNANSGVNPKKPPDVITATRTNVFPKSISSSSCPRLPPSPPSNTTSVYNPPKPTLAKINVNANSGVNPKKPPDVITATRTNVFPKSISSSSCPRLPPSPPSNTTSVYNPPKPTLAKINVNANSGVNPKKPPDVITATRTNVFPKSISSSSCPRLPPSPPSNTTSVYNPPKPTLAKINVNANSGVNPKKPPDVITATRTNVFPKSISSSSCPRLPPSPPSNTTSVYNPPKPTLAKINVNANSGVNPKKPPDVITATRTNVFPKSISSSSCPRLPPSPPSNTPSVYNPPKQTLPKINVNVNSGVNPKKPPDVTTATRTNVFPKSTKSSSVSQLPPSPSPKIGSSFSSSSHSPFGTIPSSPKFSPVSTKPILARAVSTLTSNQTKSQYNVVEKGSTPLYVIPEDIKSLIRKDIVPEILKKPLSPQTYKDYFATLLYAEDYYLEKWDGFEMKNVTLKLHEAEIHGSKDKFKNKRNNLKDEKIFVEFEVDSIPEKRPFLLSRDFASVRPAGRNVDPFQGIIFRVVRSNIVLVEFGDDFHAQHYSSCKYDVKFSFNRVCLKRAHHAISEASDMLFTKFLLPDYRLKDSYSSEKVSFTEKFLFSSYKLDSAAISRIINLNGSPTYLVEGPLSVTRAKQLSRTGMVLRDAVVQLSQASSHNRILICAPTNSTCDIFMRNLRKEVGDSNIFRANAAFRELDGVPIDILPFCPYKEKEEVFSCPTLSQLRKFKVILSTFMSSFRLYNEGIEAGHFTHIFLVDASSAIEPEILVPLTNLANVSTKVVVTGAPRNQSNWVRSNIARKNGLRTSLFERLRESKLYRDLNSEFITQLEDDSDSSSSNFKYAACS